MFILEQIREIPPLYVVMIFLFIVGLVFMGCSFSYQDCSWMHTLPMPDNCADTTFKKMLFPVGLIIHIIAVLLPYLMKIREQNNKIEINKIIE